MQRLVELDVTCPRDRVSAAAAMAILLKGYQTGTGGFEIDLAAANVAAVVEHAARSAADSLAGPVNDLLAALSRNARDALRRGDNCPTNPFIDLSVFAELRPVGVLGVAGVLPPGPAPAVLAGIDPIVSGNSKLYVLGKVGSRKHVRWGVVRGWTSREHERREVLRQEQELEQRREDERQRRQLLSNPTAAIAMLQRQLAELRATHGVK